MIQKNFTAELHCQYGQVMVADTSASHHPFSSLDEDGWLCLEQGRRKEDGLKPVTFHFSFIREETNRTLYAITCVNTWNYAYSRLKRNSNGWLGLYGTHVVGRLIDAIDITRLFTSPDIWKIETLEQWDGDIASAANVSFWLRDAEGHRVALSFAGSDSLSQRNFLNASAKDGKILTFNFHNIHIED